MAKAGNATETFNYTSSIAATAAWNSTVAAIEKAYKITALENGKTLLNATKEESDAFYYLNLIRMNPNQAINDLKELKKLLLPNNTYNISFSKGLVVTKEGNAAIDDAIKFLKGVKKLYPMYWSDGLYNATKVRFANRKAGNVSLNASSAAEFV